MRAFGKRQQQCKGLRMWFFEGFSHPRLRNVMTPPCFRKLMIAFFICLCYD